MIAGLRRHSIEVEPFRTLHPSQDADFVVTWGWRKGKAYRDAGRQVLVMERGYLGDRFAWTSLGWNGLNGRATWADDSGKTSERFDSHFGQFVNPWRGNGSGYALIIGQVPGDMSIEGIDMGGWYYDAAKAMKARGFDVRFRPHPEAVRRGLNGGIPTNGRLLGTLEDALAGAAVVVTMNSNTGVDAALAGVPTIVSDPGAMAWPVAAQGLDAELITPDRTDWLRGMAWKQFTLDEITTGEAWEHVRQVLPASSAADVTVEPAPTVVRTPPRRALILGGAKTVWEDVEAALALSEFDCVIAANDVGAHWSGKLDHWVSLHPDRLARWILERERKGYPNGFATWAHKKLAGCQIDNTTSDWKGSSGLFAAKVALELGYNRIVLCGVPLSADGAHFFDPKPWAAFQAFRFGWIAHRPLLVPHVRSMSGWTQELLGAPDRNWLAA